MLGAKQTSCPPDVNVFCLTLPGIEPSTSRISDEDASLPGRSATRIKINGKINATYRLGGILNIWNVLDNSVALFIVLVVAFTYIVV